MVLLASSTDSPGVRKVIVTKTGPNISIWASVEAGSTFVKSVGGKRSPLWVEGQLGCQQVAPSAFPWFYQLLNPLQLRRSDNCTDIDPFIKRVATRKFPSGAGVFRSFYRQYSLAEQTAPGATDFALIEPDRIDNTFDGTVQIGIFENDEGRFPTSSKDNFFPVPAVSRRIIRPTSVDPVKAICGHLDGEHAAHLSGRTGDNIDYPRG